VNEEADIFNISALERHGDMNCHEMKKYKYLSHSTVFLSSSDICVTSPLSLKI